MIKLLCVGKAAVWDYMSKQIDYVVMLTKNVGTSTFDMSMDEESFKLLSPGFWYEFSFTEIGQSGRLPDPTPMPGSGR